MLFWLNELPGFLLVFVRLTSFFVAAPLYAHRTFPNVFKIGFAFFISLIIYPSVAPDGPVEVNMEYIFLVLKEVLVGIALGFIAALILFIVQVAGGFIDFQMGFAIANVVDPQTGAQVPIIGNFKYMFALLFLLAVDGHHMLLEGVIRSYQMIAVDRFLPPLDQERMTTFIIVTFSQMFLSALQMALPMVGALFLVTVALGITARTVPQLNIFVVGIPLKIFFGFVMLLITLPMFFYLLHHVFRQMIESMGQLVYLLGG